MRILVLTNSPSSKRGGQEHSLLQVCKGLVSRNHNVQLLYDEPGDLLTEYSTAGVDLLQVHGSASSGSFSFDRRAALKSGLAFTRFIKQGIKVKPDVVYI